MVPCSLARRLIHGRQKQESRACTGVVPPEGRCWVGIGRLLTTATRGKGLHHQTQRREAKKEESTYLAVRILRSNFRGPVAGSAATI